MKQKKLLAFDLGASNGRAVLGSFDGNRITLTEVHRFDNPMVEQNGLYYWDALGLYRQLKESFQKLKGDGFAADCFGIDTWGVDFGLIDQNGALLGNPRCYRNGTEAGMAAVHAVVPQRDLFRRTGIAGMPFNTVYQLFARKSEGDPALEKAKTLLFSPDLYGFFLTGEKRTEYTIATTSMLYDGVNRCWDEETMRALDIPAAIFTEVDFAGTLRGILRSAVAEELGISQVPFAAVGTHDTASAVAAIPGEGDFAFCSSGTWSLFGVETEMPLVNDTAFEANFSNEGTVQGGFRPLKNIMGQWIMQECRRDWARLGSAYTWKEIDTLTAKAAPFAAFIDPDDAPFFSAGDMCGKITRYCEKTEQKAPETPGEFARCVYESLALKYRWTLERLEKLKGGRIDSLNITGGGIGNTLLCQMTADVLNRRVIAGPAEGSAMGNTLMQAVALGEIKDISEARQVARRSVEPIVYEPNHTQQWEDAYAKLLGYMEMKEL
ncbi:MAG: rhamnulokinase [Eubacteriales bacterium]|nr:rhamnulokinase [Eubacteriales bacterium]